jgi:hypothetical protein
VDPRAGLDDVEKRKFLTLPALELRPLGCAMEVYERKRDEIVGGWRSVNKEDPAPPSETFRIY